MWKCLLRNSCARLDTHLPHQCLGNRDPLWSFDRKQALQFLAKINILLSIPWASWVKETFPYGQETIY